MRRDNQLENRNGKWSLRIFSLSFLLLYSFIGVSQTSLVFPNNGWIQQSENLSFIWNECANADSYEISFSNSNLFTIEDIFNESSNSYTGSFAAGIYFWRVRCIIDGNPTNWSNVRSFSITNVSNFGSIAFWIAADSSLVKDGADRVSEWIDIGDNSIDFFQTTTGAQPIWEDSIMEINYKPALNFDGVDDFLEAAVNNLNVAELFVVSNWKGGQANFPNFNGLIMPNNGLLFFVAQSGTTNFFSDGTTAFAGNNFVNLAPSINYAPLNQFKLVNGRRTNPANYFETGFRVGRDRNLANRFWNGYVPEIIGFTAPLTTVYRDSLHQYLRFKYAPPVNLGTDISSYAFCDTSLSAGTRFTSFLWSTGETTESITVNQSGTYWVQVTDIFGFSSSDTIVVNYPEPELPQFALYCPDSIYTWNANLGPNYDYFWSTGEITESIEINSPDTYNLTITDTNGCSYTSPNFEFIEDTLQQSISLGPDLELCSGNQIGLVEGEVNIISYAWSTGASTSLITVQTTDEYILNVINAAGCPAADTIEVDIIGIAPNMQINFPLTQCVGVEYVFEDLSETLDNSTIISWDWDFGDGNGSVSDEGTHAYSNTGIFIVTVEINTDAGCGNTITQQVNVVENPVISFSTQGFCEKQTVNFLASQSTSALIQTWSWDFDDQGIGFTGGSASHIYADFGNYFVSLEATDVNGCIAVITQPLEIRPTPIPAFDFEEVCAGGIVSFMNNASIGGSASISSQQWNFGDGTFSSQFQPSKSYAIHGNYSITLTVNSNNGCSADSSANLKIHAFPQNNIDYSVFCAGLAGELTDNSFIPAGSVAQVNWDFGDNQSAQGFSVNHAFGTPGNQEITHQVISAFGCETTENFIIPVNDFLAASFDFNPSAFLAGFPILFENTSIGMDSLYWIIDFDTLFNQNKLNHVFSDTAIGTEQSVTLWVTNEVGCVDEKTIFLPVLERITDLAVEQIFFQEDNGFYIVGAALKNKGTTPILRAELLLRMHSGFVLKETWNGFLQAGQNENYIFSAKVPASKNQEVPKENYICVEGTIISEFGFFDIDLANNTKCVYPDLETAQDILVTPYPNPFGDELFIQLILAENDEIDLAVYDPLGRKIATIVSHELTTNGLNSYTLNTSNWSQGTYTLFLTTSKKSIAKKVIKK
jgi:PKD repeat protein